MEKVIYILKTEKDNYDQDFDTLEAAKEFASDYLDLKPYIVRVSCVCNDYGECVDHDVEEIVWSASEKNPVNEGKVVKPEPKKEIKEEVETEKAPINEDLVILVKDDRANPFDICDWPVEFEPRYDYDISEPLEDISELEADHQEEIDTEAEEECVCDSEECNCDKVEDKPEEIVEPKEGDILITPDDTKDDEPEKTELVIKAEVPTEVADKITDDKVDVKVKEDEDKPVVVVTPDTEEEIKNDSETLKANSDKSIKKLEKEIEDEKKADKEPFDEEVKKKVLNESSIEDIKNQINDFIDNAFKSDTTEELSEDVDELDDDSSNRTAVHVEKIHDSNSDDDMISAEIMCKDNKSDVEDALAELRHSLGLDDIDDKVSEDADDVEDDAVADDSVEVIPEVSENTDDDFLSDYKDQNITDDELHKVGNFDLDFDEPATKDTEEKKEVSENDEDDMTDEELAEKLYQAHQDKLDEVQCTKHKAITHPEDDIPSDEKKDTKKLEESFVGGFDYSKLDKLVGAKITHKTFGQGVINSVKEDIAEVTFDTGTKKSLSISSCIYRGLITFDDPDLANYVANELLPEVEEYQIDKEQERWNALTPEEQQEERNAKEAEEATKQAEEDFNTYANSSVLKDKINEAKKYNSQHYFDVYISKINELKTTAETGEKLTDIQGDADNVIKDLKPEEKDEVRDWLKHNVAEIKFILPTTENVSGDAPKSLRLRLNAIKVSLEKLFPGITSDPSHFKFEDRKEEKEKSYYGFWGLSGYIKFKTKIGDAPKGVIDIILAAKQESRANGNKVKPLSDDDTKIDSIFVCFAILDLFEGDFNFYDDAKLEGTPTDEALVNKNAEEYVDHLSTENRTVNEAANIDSIKKEIDTQIDNLISEGVGEDDIGRINKETNVANVCEPKKITPKICTPLCPVGGVSEEKKPDEDKEPLKEESNMSRIEDIEKTLNGYNDFIKYLENLIKQDEEAFKVANNNEYEEKVIEAIKKRLNSNKEDLETAKVAQKVYTKLLDSAKETKSKVEK